MKQLTGKHTKIACYTGYVTQAIVNNLSPLFFLIYQTDYRLSLAALSLIITVNFAVQITVDLLSAGFVDKLGYRPCMIAAHVLSAIGIAGLSVFPCLFPPYAGLMTATVLCAGGGGLLEVLVSPVIEGVPGERKASEMSLLHSFYCWGHVGVVLVTTLCLTVFGHTAREWLPFLWAVIPFGNAFLFARVPIYPLTAPGTAMKVTRLLKTPLFWLLLLLMVCAGASEQAVSQWSSYFAEAGLKVTKTTGDLLGPCCFAALMGLARILFGRTRKPDTRKALFATSCFCVLCYLICIVSSSAIVSLIACGMCGFSVGVMWPGVFSAASEKLPLGGTAMFALLALAGDIGCCGGPTLVGAVSGAAAGGSFLSGLLPGLDISQIPLKTGFCFAMLFPVILALGALSLKDRKNRR